MNLVCAPPSQSQLFIASNILNLPKSNRLVHHTCGVATSKHLNAASNSPKQHILWDPNVGSKDKLWMEHGTKIEGFRPVISSIQDPLESLLLIDAIQRLGIDYHFEEEIETILQRHYMIDNLRNNESQTLFEISLCFRLLRQGGHYVSAEIFKNFKDKKGRFNEELRKDIRGLIELYEATQLNLEGEDILFEAANFSKKNLNDSLKNLDETQAKLVLNTLKHPYHKSISKFMAKNFYKDFKGISRWVKLLQELAEVEFMTTQHMHRSELLQVLRWWKDLDLVKDMELVRDQPLKWYTWTMASLGDTKFSELRVDITKSISFVYIIDDIFDLYGTIDELTLFTQAVNGWDFAEVQQLPNYMKACFKALDDFTHEMGYKIYKKFGHNPTNLLQKQWASLCNAFLEETKWFAAGDIPKADEYLNNAKISSGVDIILVHTFFLLGHGATKESAMCLNDITKMSSSVGTILRLWDDFGSAKNEKQDGRDGSYIDYYVQEHGVTVEYAREHALQLISNEWNQLNKENLRLHKFSSSFTKACLNSARMVPLMYDYDDDQCLPLLNTHIKSVLYDDLNL